MPRTGAASGSPNKSGPSRSTTSRRAARLSHPCPLQVDVPPFDDVRGPSGEWEAVVDVQGDRVRPARIIRPGWSPTRTIPVLPNLVGQLHDRTMIESATVAQGEGATDAGRHPDEDSHRIATPPTSFPGAEPRDWRRADAAMAGEDAGIPRQWSASLPRRQHSVWEDVVGFFL